MTTNDNQRAIAELEALREWVVDREESHGKAWEASRGDDMWNNHGMMTEGMFVRCEIQNRIAALKAEPEPNPSDTKELLMETQTSSSDSPASEPVGDDEIEDALSGFEFFQGVGGEFAATEDNVRKGVAALMRRSRASAPADLVERAKALLDLWDGVNPVDTGAWCRRAYGILRDMANAQPAIHTSVDTGAGVDAGPSSSGGGASAGLLEAATLLLRRFDHFEADRFESEIEDFRRAIEAEKQRDTGTVYELAELRAERDALKAKLAKVQEMLND